MNIKKEIKNTDTLPSSYSIYQTKDLKNDKKIALLIQLIFLFIAGLMVLIAFCFKLPIKNDLSFIYKIVITIFLVFFYMIMHELTHGLIIQLLSKQKPSYRFRFPYLITGSNFYYNKKSFIMILFAPVFIWGIILITTLTFIPDSLFLSFYIVTGLNFAGSSGDFVQACLIKRLPKDILIKDDGKTTTYYTKVENMKEL